MKETTGTALMRLYAASTYEQGQHDLLRCRICGEEASWHTGVLTHKESCPVKAVRDALETEGIS